MAPTRMWQTLAVFLTFCVILYAKDIPKPIKLSEDSWEDMLEGEWLVKFYAPWCPACKALVPVWDQVATWSDDLNIKVAMVDVTENPGLSGRFLVMALPTIYHVKDGEFRTYRGHRDEKALVSFVDDKKWQEMDAMSWYRSPGSMHMGALGMFFKASMYIRSVHTSMTEEYGIPVWGSYTIFAIATIIVGLILGLFIVFLCDCMFPQSRLPPPGYRHNKSGANNTLDDSMDNDSDVILDDRPQDPNTDFQDEDVRDEDNEEESSTRKRIPRESTD